MRKSKLLIPLSFLGLLLLFSCKQDPTHLFLIGPYVQNVRSDGITISWEDEVISEGMVHYGKTKELGHTLSDARNSNLHELMLTGLDPETVYFYQVESAGKKSEVFHFRTAVNENSPFSFAVYGDNKNGPFNHEKLARLISENEPDFVLHNGDLVERGGVHKQWVKLFFTPAREMISHIPLFTIIGNHEDNDENYYNYFSPPTDNKAWYSFDYGNAHFVILQSDEEFMMEDSTQVKWLKKDLAANQHQTWRFVLLHKPPFSSGGQHYVKTRIKMKELIVPIFNEYRVDMVLSGDDHNYERTVPIGSKNAAMPITYVVCGNGGTPMRYVIPSSWTRVAKRVFGFTKIALDGTSMHYRHLTLEGEVLDEFTLDKTDPASLASYKEGMLVYETMQDVDPEVASAAREGRSLLRDGLYAEAIREFEYALARDSNCLIAKAQMAQCYVGLGDFDKARVLAMETYERIPQFPDSYEAMIEIHTQLENWEEALLWCDRLESISADSPDAARSRTEIYMDMGDLPSAIEKLKKGIEIVPNDYELHRELAELYGAVGDTTLMLQSLKQGVEWYMNPEEDAEYLAALRLITELEKRKI